MLQRRLIPRAWRALGVAAGAHRTLLPFALGANKCAVFRNVALPTPSLMTSGSCSRRFTSSSSSSGGSAREQDDDDYNQPVHDDDPVADETRAKILSAAMKHVPDYGWSDMPVVLAIRELNLSPALTGLFEHGPTVALVHHFIQTSNSKVINELDAMLRAAAPPASSSASSASASSAAEAAGSSSSSSSSSAASGGGGGLGGDHWQHAAGRARLGLGTGAFMRLALRKRLELNIPFVAHLAQSLAVVAAHPRALGSASLPLLQQFVDDLWFLAGDSASDMSWYSKRASLAAVYLAAELHMVTDRSNGFSQTWAFLDRRLEDLHAAAQAPHKAEAALLAALQVGTSLWGHVADDAKQAASNVAGAAASAASSAASAASAAASAAGFSSPGANASANANAHHSHNHSHSHGGQGSHNSNAHSSSSAATDMNPAARLASAVAGGLAEAGAHAFAFVQGFASASMQHQHQQHQHQQQHRSTSSGGGGSNSSAGFGGASPSSSSSPSAGASAGGSGGSAGAAGSAQQQPQQ